VGKNRSSVIALLAEPYRSYKTPMRYLLCHPSHLPVSFRLMILLLALGVLTGCQPGDPEESAEYKAFKEAGESGDYEQALVVAEALRDKYPDSSVGWRRIGIAHSALGDYQKAIESFHRAVELDPDDAKAHAALGHSLLQQGKMDEAIESFRRAIELDPDDAEANIYLDRALEEQSKRKKASDTR
jgi:Flp pilus assembly protein TadD